MEFSVCSGFHNSSHTYLCSPKCIFNLHSLHGVRFRRRLNSKPRLTRMSLCSEKASQPNSYHFVQNKKKSGYSWEDSECVDVFGIGSRKDAVLDFCLNSQSLWPSLRFWNVLTEESAEAQLQQRFRGKDMVPTVVEDPSTFLSCSKAVIIVATAAYGSDDIRVFDILKEAKSANGLVVGIFLKPFSFEGRRRQDEVKYLAEKLEEYSDLSIVVDTDVLLEKDLVTLDEALKTANTAVFMAINAISILLCENQKKLMALSQNNVKEVKVLELVKMIVSYKEANIGFGASYNIETSIRQAIYDCPFLPVGLKDFDGIVVCVLASSAVIDSGDINAFMHTFRQTTEYSGGILVSVVHDSNLETNIITSTVIAFGQSRHRSPQESSIFSRLAQHFPFISNLLRRHHQQSEDTHGTDLPESSLSKVINSPDSGVMPTMIAADRTDDGFGIYSNELQSLLCNEDDEMYSLSGFGSLSEHNKVEFSETSTDLSNNHHSNTEEEYAFQSEVLVRQNLGPGYGILEEWANEGIQGCEGSALLDNIRICKLPVGIKPSEELKNSHSNSDIVHQQDKVAEGSMNGPTQVSPRMSWNVFSDAGQVVSEFYDSTFAILRGTSADVSKKQGLLSVRAASMLEAERDSQKKWNPIVEMKYKGGIYRGRCQGGLPEGKGRLSLGDGSIYDGLWRYGKKSGLGSFYFSNGDVFQGSWRDDVMHGKGWLYFHTGDRWFANFWKGKANGEGRFYSKLGEIFFGHFKNGWRHGHFICINVDGTRRLEIWNEGILVSRKQLDADTETS